MTHKEDYPLGRNDNEEPGMNEVPALAIGSEVWPGVAKLIEECGELLQVLGKLAAYPDADHPDGTNLTQRLEDELGDVLAGCEFVIQTSPRLNGQRIDHRRIRKLTRFHGWQNQDPVACGRILVGQGSDTYDPLCVLPNGHAGSCRP